jgi:DNA processing protein
VAIDSRIDAWATLAQKALPERALLALLQAFPDPEAVLRAKRRALIAHVPAATVDKLLAPVDPARLAKARAWLEEPGHELIAWDDADYPRALLDIGDAPPVLFFVGRRELLNRPALAIVGSRNGTPQGCDNAREFAAALSDAGYTIVSGLAVGIDAAAHEGALDRAGSTLAVVGTGLDRVYPARHRALAHRIAEQGGLLSEFTPGTPPLKENFPRRNRLLAGLSRGVLVVEATLQSGSLITARLAGEQGREVFAIPGSIHSPLSRGCHRLIRDGAKLVETAEDVLAELRWPAHAVQSPRDEEERTRDVEDALLDAMGYDPIDVDTLVQRVGRSAGDVAAALVTRELEGVVASLPGGMWQRRRA